MTRNGLSGSSVLAVLICAMMFSPVRAGSYLFQLAQSSAGADAYIVTTDVSNVANPVFVYQVTGVGSSDIVNADGFDPSTNRLYFVDTTTSSNQAQLEYAQINAQGKVVGQTDVGTITPPVSFAPVPIITMDGSGSTSYSPIMSMVSIQVTRAIPRSS